MHAAVVALLIAATPDAGPPAPRALTRSEILEGLDHPDVAHGCLIENTWGALTAGPLTPETLTTFIALLKDPKLSPNKQTLLMLALGHQTDPVARTYLRQLVPNAAALAHDPTPAFWAGTREQIALTALVRRGTPEDLDRLVGLLGTTMKFDRAFAFALQPDTTDEVMPERSRALAQRIFDTPNQDPSVRSAALEALSRLGPPPVDALRSALADPALRRVSLDAFTLWFRPEDLATVSALDIATAYEAGTLDDAVARWFGQHPPGPEARAWLEGLRTAKKGTRLPRTAVVLGLWASSQQAPELARAAHAAGLIPLGPAPSVGARTVHKACLAALDHRADVLSVPDRAELSFAHSLLRGSPYPTEAAACLARLPPVTPEKAKPKRPAR